MKTSKYSQMANEASIKRTREALAKNGIYVFLVDDKDKAKEKIMELIPSHSEVMTMTSVTLEDIGIPSLIKKSPEFISIRNKLMEEDIEEMEKRRL